MKSYCNPIADGTQSIWFSRIMGLFALVAGAGEFYGGDLPLFAIFLIVIGASLILKPLFKEAR